VSIAGHKLEGPKGIGALWIRRGVAILPQQHGGSQERYRRAGTEHVAGAAGMGRAFELLAEERPATVPHVRALRDRLQAVVAAQPGVELTGHPRDRLPNHLSIIVRDAEGEAVVMALDLDGVCASTGSACTSGSTEPSHVLTAMGFPDDEARGALRLSLGRTTTPEEIERAAAIIPAAIERVRAGQLALVAGQARPAAVSGG
jgi:cysteine desulfurase